MRHQRGDVKVIRRLTLVAVALAALGATAAPAFAQGDVSVGQSGWKWGNPQPQGNTLRQIEFAPGTGYAAGEFGTLLRTDSGIGWTGIPTGMTSDITELRAVDADTVIIGSGCVMRRSDDRGDNFRRVPFVARETNCPSPLATFHFPNDQVGYVVLADGSVSQTTDGGQSFGGKREVPGTQAAGGGQAVPTDVYFVNPTTGFATAGGNLYRTTNSADTWELKSSGGAALNSVYFPDATTGYAVGDNNTILKSTDGGDTWNPVGVPGPAQAGKLTSVRCSSPSVCVIATEAGDKLLRTTDGGTNITAEDPGQQKIFAATFSSATGIVGVGEFGATVISNDFGTSAPTASFIPVGNRLGAGDDIGLSRVRATNANLVHAPGTRGRVGRSTDGGKGWATVQVPTAQDLTDVSFPDADTGFAIDTSDALRFTGNGGAQWTPIDTGDTPSVNSILALDRNTAMLFTDRGIYRSTAAADTSGGGTTFEAVDNSKVRKASFKDFDRTDGQVLFAWGVKSLWTSNNRGATWRTVNGPVKKPAYRAVDFVSSRLGFALTTDGRVWTTKNGGRKWAELPGTGTNEAEDMAWGDSRHGYLVIPSWGSSDEGGWVLATSDGGATWRPQLVREAELLPAGLEAPAASNAFALGIGIAGRGADLFRTDTGGDQGDVSAITVKPATKRIKKASTVRLTVQLAPTVSGVQVALFERAGKSTRWKLVRQGTTTAGKLTIDRRIKTTSRYVAQWGGDADRNGDGSPVTTVTLKK
jgi:photosystem II stability/assembly factor-like uncharacterized protein